MLKILQVLLKKVVKDKADEQASDIINTPSIDETFGNDINMPPVNPNPQPQTDKTPEQAEKDVVMDKAAKYLMELKNPSKTPLVSQLATEMAPFLDISRDDLDVIDFIQQALVDVMFTPEIYTHIKRFVDLIEKKAVKHEEKISCKTNTYCYNTS